MNDNTSPRAVAILAAVVLTACGDGLFGSDSQATPVLTIKGTIAEWDAALGVAPTDPLRVALVWEGGGPAHCPSGWRCAYSGTTPYNGPHGSTFAIAAAREDAKVEPDRTFRLEVTDLPAEPTLSDPAMPWRWSVGMLVTYVDIDGDGRLTLPGPDTVHLADRIVGVSAGQQMVAYVEGTPYVSRFSAYDWQGLDARWRQGLTDYAFTQLAWPDGVANVTGLTKGFSIMSPNPETAWYWGTSAAVSRCLATVEWTGGSDADREACLARLGDGWVNVPVDPVCRALFPDTTSFDYRNCVWQRDVSVAPTHLASRDTPVALTLTGDPSLPFWLCNEPVAQVTPHFSPFDLDRGTCSVETLPDGRPYDAFKLTSLTPPEWPTVCYGRGGQSGGLLWPQDQPRPSWFPCPKGH